MPAVVTRGDKSIMFSLKLQRMVKPGKSIMEASGIQLVNNLTKMWRQREELRLSHQWLEIYSESEWIEAIRLVITTKVALIYGLSKPQINNQLSKLAAKVKVKFKVKVKVKLRLTLTLKTLTL